MATVLYITAHPLTESESYSLKVGKAFLDAYREAAPDDEITHLDLFRMDLPFIDDDVLHAWKQMDSVESVVDLPGAVRHKVVQLRELAIQFATADKYIFVSPLWNLSYPPALKAYIDAICAVGLTFKYTEHGPVGLLKNKKAVHIQSQGGIYSEGPASDMEFGHRHLATVLHFLGVESVEGLFIEGHDRYPERASEILADAIQRAKETARRFADPVPTGDN